MASTPFLPLRQNIAGPYQMDPVWQEWARRVQGIIININQIPGVNRFTYTELNALGLGAGDANYVAWEPDYGHMLQWSGTVWKFAPGDPGNGFWSLRPLAPQEVGWQLCDGTATDYLTLGATLTVTAHTTPNVTAGTFLKVLAAYTGTIEAAIAATATISGSTGSTAGSTGPPNTGSAEVDFNNDGVTKTVATNNHDHPVDSHSHSAGSLAAAVTSAARPPSLGGLLYFRR